ncbi:hypothetical protein JHK84_039412 [Glycine max]|nr:hypothetical protein JHK86_039186 [Glycine max]KAG4964790.1 hypothetical protein JHK85_039765 [Glycine max]KAG5121072.1 hypothetical protein JHK84_039412 [Glycine max]
MVQRGPEIPYGMRNLYSEWNTLDQGQFSVSRIYVKDILAEGAAELRPHKYSVV